MSLSQNTGVIFECGATAGLGGAADRAAVRTFAATGKLKDKNSLRRREDFDEEKTLLGLEEREDERGNNRMNRQMQLTAHDAISPNHNTEFLKSERI